VSSERSAGRLRAASVWRDRTRFLAATLVFLFLLVGSSHARAETRSGVDAAVATDTSAGKSLYRDGVLESGERVPATVQYDVPVLATELSCAYCHRLSGLGTSEGSNVAPAVTAASLHQPRVKMVRQAYRSKAGSGHERPAYTDETLALAIRTGVDAGGRILDRLMPRYQIDDENMASLIAYLKTLSAEDAPGVTKETLHIATIVTEGVADADRASMLGVLEGYLEVKNRVTRNELRNAEYAPFYRKLPHRAYRKWALHIWELKGPPETWQAQLDAHYARQPVFAVVNGIAVGSWAPIHEFCVDTEVPCLFPHTDLPVTSRQDFYPLYLSGGLDLEARALARHLQKSEVPRNARIVQVWEAGGAGETPARVLREVLEEKGFSSLEDRVVPAAEAATAGGLQRALAGEEPNVLVLWLPEPDLDALASITDRAKGIGQVYLSSSLCGSDLVVPAGLRPLVRRVHPFDVPKNKSRKLARLNNWLDSRDLERREQRIQADAYFAITFLARGMKHLNQNFSREYLIEVLEHALDNATFTSVYPRVSLGPGQRFASKGSYILELSSDADSDSDGEWKPVGDWIIP
jgi:ABC-type branched-subunit amino acid transport system substrate-binding protein